MIPPGAPRSRSRRRMRPKRVRARMTESRISGPGTPKSRPCRIQLKPGVISGLVKPPVRISADPETMLIMPRVTINGLRRSRVAKTRLTTPTSTPRRATITASHTYNPTALRSAITTPTRPVPFRRRRVRPVPFRPHRAKQSRAGTGMIVELSTAGVRRPDLVFAGLQSGYSDARPASAVQLHGPVHRHAINEDCDGARRYRSPRSQRCHRCGDNYRMDFVRAHSGVTRDGPYARPLGACWHAILTDVLYSRISSAKT